MFLSVSRSRCIQNIFKLCSSPGIRVSCGMFPLPVSDTGLSPKRAGSTNQRPALATVIGLGQSRCRILGWNGPRADLDGCLPPCLASKTPPRSADDWQLGLSLSFSLSPPSKPQNHQKSWLACNMDIVMNIFNAIVITIRCNLIIFSMSCNRKHCKSAKLALPILTF